jgi:hypothetical protein
MVARERHAAQAVHRDRNRHAKHDNGSPSLYSTMSPSAASTRQSPLPSCSATAARHAKIAVGPVQVPDDVLAVQPAPVLWTGLKDASRIGSAQADGVLT